jgi:hypothetical protein
MLHWPALFPDRLYSYPEKFCHFVCLLILIDNVGICMTESKRIQELNRKIKNLKKTGTGGSDF